MTTVYKKHRHWKSKLSRGNVSMHPLLSGASLSYLWCDLTCSWGKTMPPTWTKYSGRHVLIKCFLKWFSPKLYWQLSQFLFIFFMYLFCTCDANHETNLLLIYVHLYLKRKIADNRSKKSRCGQISIFSPQSSLLATALINAESGLYLPTTGIRISAISLSSRTCRHLREH